MHQYMSGSFLTEFGELLIIQIPPLSVFIQGSPGQLVEHRWGKNWEYVSRDDMMILHMVHWLTYAAIYKSDR